MPFSDLGLWFLSREETVYLLKDDLFKIDEHIVSVIYNQTMCIEHNKSPACPTQN